ncbi:hypothetical protein ABBQ32_002998 [Trebouxia sp. C0010 RCD-2024]
MQASQILRGMLNQPRCAFAAPAAACNTSTRCSCSGRSLPHVQRLTLQAPAARQCHFRICRKQLRTAATSGASADLPASQASASNSQGGLSKSNTRSLQGVAIVAAIAAAAAFVLYQGGHFPAIKEYIAHSPVGRSGCLAAFALIFASEIGDKTFFIAALLAMRVGKWLSFTGSVAALSLMTFISVAIGVVFKNVPKQLSSSIPIGQYLGTALLVYFGLKTLKEAWDTPDDAESGSELESAESSLSSYTGSLGGAWWQKFFEVGSLIFVAEWGDRSMLATIALGAAQSPAGVATGAIFGHAIATAIAVIGGSIASQYISEKTIGYIGGVLFLAFAVATALGYF